MRRVCVCVLSPSVGVPYISPPPSLSLCGSRASIIHALKRTHTGCDRVTEDTAPVDSGSAAAGWKYTTTIWHQQLKFPLKGVKRLRHTWKSLPLMPQQDLFKCELLEEQHKAAAAGLLCNDKALGAGCVGDR